MGLDLTQLRSVVADTDSVGYSSSSGGSRTTYATGITAIEAARDVIAKMSERAATLWDVPAETVSYQAGVFTTKHLVGEDLSGRQVGLSRPLEGTRTQYILETGRTLVRADMNEENQFLGDQADAEARLRSGIILPLVSNGQIIATMGLRSRRVGAYGPREQTILERLAGQIAPALENAGLYEERIRAQEELRASEERLRTIMENMPDGVLLVVEGEIIYANPALATMLGYENAP